MNSLTKETIIEKLKKVIDPEIHRDIVTLNMIKDVSIKGCDVALTLELPRINPDFRKQIEADVSSRLREIAELGGLDLTINSVVRSVARKNSIPGVKHVIAVGSGKGGVGKSTVATNLAITLMRDGARVGLLDADIHGPNIPTMMGVFEPKGVEGGKIFPAEMHDIKIVSIGFFLNPDEPVIWRGPMLHGAIRQFLQDVEWGELDYLIADLPPGTGDVQLTMSQMIPLAGAVIVATPQRVALEDAAKAIAMFKKVEVPILGVVENMSYLACPHCDEKIDLYGEGGAESAAAKWGYRFLGGLPLDPRVRLGGDTGKPIALGEGPMTEAFRKVARNMTGEISVRVLSTPREISLDGLILEQKQEFAV